MRTRVWEAVCILFLSAATMNALCIFVTTTVLADAQAAYPGSWVGVWQGELDGQPSVVLTLAQDNGSLEGTLVLNIVSRDNGQPHIIAREPHVLMHLRVDRNTLAFQLKRIDGSNVPMDFTVLLTSSSGARIHCLNCGDDAPTVEMTRLD